MKEDLIEARSILFNIKPYEALLELYKDKLFVQEISRAIDTNRSHTTKLVNRFEEYGLAKSEQVGRKKYVELTAEGSELAEHLRGVEELLMPESRCLENNGQIIRRSLEGS